MFFAWPGFFEHLKICKTLYILDDVAFSKGSRTNRVQYYQNMQSKWLSIPIHQKSNQLIMDIKIDNNSDWRRSHFSIIKNTMSKNTYYADVIEIIDKTYALESFIEITIASITNLIEYLEMPIKVKKSSDIKLSSSSSDRVLDIMKHSGSKTYITGHGAFNYLNHNLLEDNEINTYYVKYSLFTWHGVPSPYFTILDMISKYGKKTFELLNGSITHWKEFGKK